MPATRKFLRDYCFRCLGLPKMPIITALIPDTTISRINEHYIGYKIQSAVLIDVLFNTVIYRQRYDRDMYIPHILGIYIEVLQCLLNSKIKLHYVQLFCGLNYRGIGFNSEELNSCLASWES